MPTRSDASNLSSRSGFQPALDGVRAVAIIGVLLSHTAVGASGGFVGVYMFFALSGYLITSLLLRERQVWGSIDLLVFWGRRAARLAPVVIALVIVVVVLSSFFGDGDHAGRDAALPVLLNVSNWIVAFGPSDGAGLGVLFHTWSLSVEEQFYVVWPLLVVLGTKLAGRTGVITIASVGIVASGVARTLLYDPTSPWRAIRATDTMAELLLWGCLLAALLAPGSRSSVWLRRKLAPWSGWVGLVLILVVVAPVERQLVHTLGATIVAAATCGLVLHLTDARDFRLTKMLSARWLVGIGTLSYSLYVWHTLAMAAFIGRFGNVWLDAAAMIVASFAMAVPSYLLLERPIRNAARARLVRRPAPVSLSRPESSDLAAKTRSSGRLTSR